MRIAIVSDVHGNLAALEAVIADLEEQRPELVVHGGDLAWNGPRPVECVDRVRELGWPGVKGNMDEALATHRHDPRIGWTTERIGGERLDWLLGQPLEWRDEDRVALVHAVPGDLWRAVKAEADDSELRSVYGPLGARLAVYCHIHRPYVRDLGDLTVANSGSVGLPFDGDPRASYLLITDGRPENRRVEYDVERAVREAEEVGHPSAAGLARAWRSGTPPG